MKRWGETERWGVGRTGKGGDGFVCAVCDSLWCGVVVWGCGVGVSAITNHLKNTHHPISHSSHRLPSSLPLLSSSFSASASSSLSPPPLFSAILIGTLTLSLEIVGLTAGVMVCFILPAAFYYKVRAMKGTANTVSAAGSLHFCVQTDNDSVLLL